MVSVYPQSALRISTTGRVAGMWLLLLLLLLSSSSLTASPEDDPKTQKEQPQSAQKSAGHEDPTAPVLLALIVILGGAKLGGELFERIGQPAVMGELIAGVVLGNLVLLNPSWTFLEPLRAEEPTVPWAAVVDSFSRIGVILLLFEVGLESTVGEMRKVGGTSLLVAMVGVVAPFVLGYGVSAFFIREVPAAVKSMSPDFDLLNIHLFIGATLTATSVGITARVLKDLGKMQLPESKILLGAAVIDDVLGLLILSIVAAIVVAAETGGGGMSSGDLAIIIAKSAGFLVLAIGLGVAFMPRLMAFLSKFRSGGILIVAAIIFCFTYAYVAHLGGLAAIVGAFCAGLVLEDVHFKDFRGEKQLEDLLKPVISLLVPVFFVVMGLRVRLETFADMSIIGIALALTIAAFIGKQICGLVVRDKRLNRLLIGLGMVPRGEVGLIFAGIGMVLGVVDAALYSAIVIMVILTTFATPPLLKMALRKTSRSKE
jgi:Kef-type K+ transport system membrane component KefB